MPPLETDDLNETATVWPRGSYDDYGARSVSSPIEIPVRWEEVDRNQLDPQSDKIRYDALAVVDRKVEKGSLIRLGTLDDWQGTGSGSVESGLMEVVGYNETPDLKGRSIRRTITMIRYKDTLP